jgi:hypothetical protein
LHREGRPQSPPPLDRGAGEPANRPRRIIDTMVNDVVLKYCAAAAD